MSCRDNFAPSDPHKHADNPKELSSGPSSGHNTAEVETIVGLARSLTSVNTAKPSAEGEDLLLLQTRQSIVGGLSQAGK